MEALKERYDYNILDWWENLVKPGVKAIIVNHTKHQNKDNQGKLNMLMLSQYIMQKKLKKTAQTHSKI